MAEAVISKEEIMAVFPTVQKTMADALGCDVDDIKLDVSLIEGLDAESIDFLDMVFRLERAFKIKVPRGKIIEDVRGDMPVSEFEENGVLTEKGLARLREYLSGIEFSVPKINLVNNVDVAIVTDPALIKDALVRQAASPVRWVETVQKIAATGATRLIECGPGKVLSGLTKRIQADMQADAVFDQASLDATLETLK